jgi:Coenzyme PQQ synthesis protein D (PqqD)
MECVPGPPAIREEKVFRRNGDIVTRKIADELFLVPIRGKLADMQRIFTLDPVAEYIWGELDGRKNIGEISKGLLNEFDVEEGEALADTEEFISELLQAGLISEDA